MMSHICSWIGGINFISKHDRRRIGALAGVCLTALGMASISAVFADESEREIPECKPVPKLLHYEIVDPGESRISHPGQVRLGFTIGLDGLVSDVTVVESTDHWLDGAAVQSVRKWSYRPPTALCHSTTKLNFSVMNPSRSGAGANSSKPSPAPHLP